MSTTRLPDAELFIMKIIWQEGGEVTSAQLMERLKGKRSWAVTTVLNFLIRLVERGFLAVRKNGKSNIYSPVIAEQDYLELESRSFLERLHGNSFSSLVASLYGGKAISGDDLAELQAYINEKAGGGS